MQYEGDVYRPPSEARSLIIQVTIGCSHNKCTFCHMYTDKQFRVRKREEILADLDECRDTYGPYVQRVFFADGDALVVKTELLLELLHYVKKNFPYAERITSYGTAKDVLRKSEEELVALRKAGLAMIYLGAESGDDEVLVHIQKGETAAEIIAAGQKLKRCGIQTSVTLISGLGGSKGMAAFAMLFVGLLVTMGIGSSFSTLPIITAIYVPLCISLGFSPLATVAIVGTAGALGDAGSPASDSTLGPTMGLNADGQHDHIRDSVVPTFIHYNIPLLIAGWIAAMVL